MGQAHHALLLAATLGGLFLLAFGPHMLSRAVLVTTIGRFAATLKKGAHVQVEGELRGREYDKDGVKHRVFECRLGSIFKLDHAERRGEDESDGSES